MTPEEHLEKVRRHLMAILAYNDLPDRVREHLKQLQAEIENPDQWSSLEAANF